jgi:hypothetical protein
MQQIFQAYGETILRLVTNYGKPVTIGVLAILAGGAVLRAIARFQINRGPRDG